MKGKSQGKVCCVPGCPNTQKKNPSLSFYSFPNRDYETVRKKLWIVRVRRKGDENGAWVPTKHTRICAEHFVGCVKSNNPTQENFNPTIFPWNQANESFEARRQRLVFCNEKKNVNLACKNEEPDLAETGVQFSALPEGETREISVQTDESLFGEFDQNEIFFYCWQDSATNDTETQTLIPINHRAKTKIIEIPVTKAVKRRAIAVDSDNEMQNGFQGYTI